MFTKETAVSRESRKVKNQTNPDTVFFLSYHFIPPRCDFYFYEHNCHIFPRVTTNRQEGSQEEKSGPACPTLSLILYCLHQFGCCWRVLKTPEETADNNITHLGVTFCLQFESH